MAFSLLPHLLPISSIKETGNQTLNKMVLGGLTLVRHLLGLLAFRIKSLFLASTPRLLDLLACCAASRVSLDSVTQTPMFQFTWPHCVSGTQTLFSNNSWWRWKIRDIHIWTIHSRLPKCHLRNRTINEKTQRTYKSLAKKANRRWLEMPFLSWMSSWKL